MASSPIQNLLGISEAGLRRGGRGYVLANETPKRLLTLLRKATTALRVEDGFLQSNLVAGQQWRRPTNRGLAYSLFETTLVYLVFCEWLKDGVRVDWEESYPKPNGRKKTDLVVWHEADPRLARIVVETKLWNRRGSKGRVGIAADLKKLALWKSDGEPPTKLLLAFWWAPYEEWKKDRKDVIEGCNESGALPVFLSAFPTHFHSKTKREYYFALLALDASAPR